MIAESSAVPTGAEIHERILGGFRGEVAPQRPSPRYQAALVAVAIAMVLLPIAYLGLITALGWGLWAYARFAASHWSEYPSRLSFALVYIPLSTGAVVLLCLLKPLVARFERPRPPIRLDPKDEPLLFAFVARLCAALHAPVPREIQVDCEVNASASFRRGGASLFQNDLVLRLGLPLVAGLPLQQLAGVMAHELGHFSQTAGLRVGWVIRTINAWLARLVYQRDWIDLALARRARREQVLYLALYTVAFTRKILWALMMLGHAISSFLMRQMEYDADRYEVRLAGFSAFDICMRELVALGIAQAMTIDTLQEQWQEGRLVNNLPRMLVANRRRAAREIAQAIETQISGKRAGRFDTHPTLRQRTAQALREKGVGIFTSDLPASALFSNLEALERRSSLDFYREQLGDRVTPKNLIDLDEINARQERRQTEGSSLDRYFQNPIPLHCLALPASLTPAPADPTATLRYLATARRAHSTPNKDHALAGDRYLAAVKARVEALQAYALIEAGLKLRPSQLNFVEEKLPAVTAAANKATEELDSSARELATFEQKESRRLVLTLSLLETPIIEAHAGSKLRREEAERLLAVVDSFRMTLWHLFRVRMTLAVLKILDERFDPNKKTPGLAAVIRKRFGTLRTQLTELHGALEGQAYPFDHLDKEITLARFALPEIPEADDFGGLLDAAEQAIQRLVEVYERLLGRLVWLATQVEKALAAAARAAVEAPPVPAALPDPEPARVPPLPSEALPAMEIVESKAEAVASRDPFAIYFKDVPELRPLDLPALPAAERSALEEARGAATQGMAAYAQRSCQYQAAERKHLQALRAEQILSAGLPLSPADFSPLPTTLPLIVQAGGQALAEMNALEPGLQAFETILAQRLVAALSLSLSRNGEIPPLLAGALALQRSFPVLRNLRQRYTILRGLAEQVAVAGKDPRFRACVGEQVVEVHKHLQELQRALQGAFNPFSDDPGQEGRRDLSQLILPTLPRPNDVNANFQTAGSALRELPDLHRRILGRLAGMADEVERSLETA